MHLAFYKYRIPFKTPFVTAGQTFSDRSGIIALLEKDGHITLGEAAPLPGFSAETTQQVIRQIRSNIKPIKQFLSGDFSLSDLNDFLNNQDLAPSLQFCLYTMAASHLALAKNQPLQQSLFDNPADSVAVNAVVDLAENDVSGNVNQKVKQGFATIKIKAGKNTGRLFEKLTTIRNQHPDINIRLDANQSWTLPQAIQIFKKIEPLNIEYCEEPLANPDQQSLVELKNNFSVPIALDESLAHTFSLTQAATLANALIIKPMVLGPVVRKLIKISRQTNIKIVFTSSLESAVGRLMTATLAAGLGSVDTAHGLATGGLLAEDLWRDNDLINEGQYILPPAKKLTALMQSPLTGITAKRLNIR